MSEKLERIPDINTKFDKWYTSVVKQAELMEYGEVKGTMIIKPYAWKMWEIIQQELNKKFKNEDIDNIAMPMFIPKSLIDKEKQHIKGFAPEILTITKYGNNELEEPFYLKPTSETLFMNQFKKEIQSFRTLPIKWNQWCSVVRWEKKTRPFLRSTEFHWQEGHTVHATPNEAKNFAIKMLNHYHDLIKEILAIPVFIGVKSESERFAGAQETYTIEAMMKNGKALQSATSHYFGDNFTKAYDIVFQNKSNKTEFPYTTSWGISTRILGAIIMVHGDEKGLVLPPKIAPYQAILLPLINKKNKSALVMAQKIKEKLSQFRVKIDSSDKTLGFKSAEAEIKGIPIRIELGPRDLEKNEVTIVKRNTGEKIQFNLDSNLVMHIEKILQQIQEEMYTKANNIKTTKTKSVSTYEDLKKQVKIGYALANWCESKVCEQKIKEEIGATTRCMAYDRKVQPDNNCIKCSKKAKTKIYIALAY